VLVLFGIGKTIVSKDYIGGIWPAGIGTVLTVLALLLCSAWNNTAYYPSTADLQSSLTLQNSCSSEFTLTTMFYVSLLVPFVLAYIVYAWHVIDAKKLDKDDIKNDHAYQSHIIRNRRMGRALLRRGRVPFRHCQTKMILHYQMG
jgi:cytochrome d ubiquinol oxidase subunit II